MPRPAMPICAVRVCAGRGCRVATWPMPTSPMPICATAKCRALISPAPNCPAALPTAWRPLSDPTKKAGHPPDAPPDFTMTLDGLGSHLGAFQRCRRGCIDGNAARLLLFRHDALQLDMKQAILK